MVIEIIDKSQPKNGDFPVRYVAVDQRVNPIKFHWTMVFLYGFSMVFYVFSIFYGFFYGLRGVFPSPPGAKRRTGALKITCQVWHNTSNSAGGGSQISRGASCRNWLVIHYSHFLRFFDGEIHIYIILYIYILYYIYIILYI